MGLLYHGRGVQCPVCGGSYRKFLPYGYVESRPNALCPKCLSLERHRLLWLYLQRETTLLTERKELLHIAPEVCLMKRLKRVYASSPKSYITADLESPIAQIHFDVQDIPLEDNSQQVIICNHIMEHVEDDIKAMSELHRIMRPGGWGVILSPIDLGREATFEDDSITDEKERTRIFGQYDHRRVYGRDYSERLASVGFRVEDIDYKQNFTLEEQKLYALCEDHLYIVHKD